MSGIELTHEVQVFEGGYLLKTRTTWNRLSPLDVGTVISPEATEALEAAIEINTLAIGRALERHKAELDAAFKTRLAGPLKLNFEEEPDGE